MVIEDVSFAEHQFAANDFVTGGGVAGEIDAADEVLLLFVEIEREVYEFSIVVSTGSLTATFKYPALGFIVRIPASRSSFSLERSKVLCSTGTSKSHIGTEMGRELCIALMSLRLEKAWLPWKAMVPTLTLGPSSMVKTSLTALVEGIFS